uniref:Uncharacterized protein n=1 Tax=Anguilla anguilla TaxID=7936 RepID=A0A0E9RW61_ANGAN
MQANCRCFSVHVALGSTSSSPITCSAHSYADGNVYFKNGRTFWL